ncbi:predicted protein [Histoplasma mississippiense (nom. inval.)]|uniref:predicted protein n=1 Tax=Ajellomyces capsulatus (strain NAm1 / WU24) TaxID=2059318 RepID=UPI000157BC9C|nr:predicted protein [Histoplasma mississippiense (nom. inval.)]EDN06104.1 predicted protein [Histoplasma mississippiense (nom. inval.)]
MSIATSSPRSIENQSPNLSAFKAQIYSDPFLPNPSNNNNINEQLSLHPHGEPATVNLSELESHHHNGQLSGEDFHGSLPVSPNNIHLPSGSKGGTAYTRPNTNPSSNVQSPTSHQDFLSPSDYAENGYSDFSSYGSPEIDDPFFLEPEFGFNPESEPLTLPGSEALQHHNSQDNEPSGHNEQKLETTTLTASQLLSPGLTNTPSPPSDSQNMDFSGMNDGRDKAHRPSRMDIHTHRFQHTPTLTTSSPCSDTLEVSTFSHRDQPTSPIVKVSSYTRGDSPSRGDDPTEQRSDKRGRPTISSSHLAPTGNKHEYDYDDIDDSHYVGSQYRSISVPPPSSRADDGSWVASSSTGQRGLDPACRGDIYVPSPKEMMEQRKREQKNADVEQWLSVSEVNSEVQDNGAFGRRPSRRNKLVTFRRRAKSTGDPVATHQQFLDDSKIPGPGVLIDEDSGLEDIEDDNDSNTSNKIPETPPAKVDLDSRVELSGGYFPPVTNDDEAQNAEPLPRQFIRARPWQDQLRNPRIGDTRHQPSTSNAAMSRFGRAAENIETASRAATWGTTRRMSESDMRSLHAANGSFIPSYVDKEKKHTRRNSIFKHTNKLLPKRSNSNAKLPTLASPRQDKALAPSPMSGKGQLDDEEDEDDEDEPMGDKGVTMDFAIRTDPIVPTLDGFKTQIQQLNPRLKSPALIERFAQEQLRRYKKLVELKLQHAQAVSMQNCTSGKHCFEQGGEATMLPPKISSKDPDATCAQFQITSSANPDGDMSSFGEGTVTAALFPNGVLCHRGRGSGNGKGAAKKMDNQQSSIPDQEVEQVWKLVEECHHVTSKQPKDEPCRFCDNVCNSWKKLSVHMAKHMEQVAMPILGLVKQRTICADTPISPIELGSYSPRPKVESGQSPAMSPLPGTGPFRNPFQLEQAPRTSVGHSTLSNSKAQNTESYATAQSPLVVDHLQMHTVQNELTAVSLRMGGRSISAGGERYNLSPYPRPTSPSVGEQRNVYPVTTRTGQQQFSSHHTSTTYPPLYNAVSRRLESPISDMAQAPVGETVYSMDASAVASSSTAYGNQQQMYTSPVEHAGYVYQQSRGGIDSSGVMNFNDIAVTVQYPVVSGPDTDPAGQSEGFGQHRGGPHHHQSQ